MNREKTTATLLIAIFLASMLSVVTVSAGGIITLDHVGQVLNYGDGTIDPCAWCQYPINIDSWTLTIDTNYDALVEIGWFDWYQTYDVYELRVDGELEGTNPAGGTETIEVVLTPGVHTIEVEWIFYQTDQLPIPGGSYYDITFTLLGPVEVWVDDDYTSSTPGWETTHWDEIQEGIDAVTYYGTVNVLAGTYAENIVIDKSLTVKSIDGAEVTTIDAQGVPIAVLINGEETTATFEGFTVDNYDTIGVLAGAFSDTLQGVTLGEDPLAVHLLNNIIKPPTIEGPHNNNIQIGDGTTGTVIGNEVFGAFLTSPDWSGSGILVAGSSDVLISDNYVHNCEGGIQILGYEYKDAPAVDNLIENNLVEDCDAGISVQGYSIGTIIRYNDVLNNDVGIGSLAYDFSYEQSTPSGTEVHYNNIVGNENYGVKSSVWWHHTGVVLAEEVDATMNWWGHASGPSGESGRINPAGKVIGRGDAVSGAIWDPCLPQPVFHTPHDPVPPGLD